MPEARLAGVAGARPVRGGRAPPLSGKAALSSILFKRLLPGGRRRDVPLTEPVRTPSAQPALAPAEQLAMHPSMH